MANSNKTKFISNISKRFSEIFEKSKPTVITMEPSESQRTLNTYDKNSIFQNKTNKVVPFYEETRYSRRKNDKSLTEIRKKMKTYPNKGSFLFQTLMKTNSHNSDENYEFENEGIFNYNDKQEKFELLNQLQQILSKDDNEEDYKLVKLLKNEGEEIKNELGMIDLFEKESEKFEKLSFQHSCLLVQKKNSFELLQIYADSYPYLGFRKSLLYIKILTSFYCEALIKLQFFKNFIFFVIILNSFVMALEDTRKEDPVFLQMEKFFLIVYTIEMLLKIFGMGLIWRKKSYFRDSWNVFDFVIIMTSYLPLIISTSVESFKFSSFKILRILRPLRTISSIKSLHLIFLTLVTSLPLLFDILIILGFFFLSFAIVGNNLFSDLLKNRCFDPVNGLKSSLGDVLCGYESCKDFFICGKMISNPNYEVMNFDNIFYSLIMVFQCITLQSWSYIMFSIVKVFNPWSEIYFIIIIIFGAFFLLNLTLAVIKTKFTDVQKIQKTGLINDATIKDGANDLNVLDLKRFKKIERTHFKRRKLDIEGIGASKENHSKMNELTWENLFELKERIKEEKEREEADKKFREEREENLKDEEKFVLYKKKIEQKKKKSFNIFLSQISSKKKIQDTQISSSMAFQKLGIKEFQNENNADKENLNEKELNDMEKLLDHNFIFFPKSIKKFIDHDNLQLNDLKEITKNPKSKLKFSNFLDSLLNNQPDDINVNAIRNSIFLDLPKIKEETNSNDVSAILSLSDSIKSPKSSILNDSDFYNSFTLRKCKLLELNEKGKSTNALKLELSMNNFNASIERIVNETSFLPNNQMFSNPTNNTLAIETSLFPKRKSILKKSELGENLQKVNISNFEEMKIPEKKIILDKVVQLPKKAKKNKNIRYYKLMVNFFKEIVSYSKDDVMEHR